jgi:hypothetical protein
MYTQITIKKLVSPLVLLLALAVAGCNRAHNDNVQNNGPDQLPMRLQLPKDGSSEALRIVQYAQDNITRKAQQSLLTKGPYSGGRELRIYDDNNELAQIVILYSARAGQKEQVGYVADFSDGVYSTEKSFSQAGTRVTEGQRLPDGTFEQSTYQEDGKTLFKHAIFGRLMNDGQKLVWKVLGDEVYREDGTVGAVQQLMDDGSVFSQFYDEHHYMTETLYVGKDGKPKSETDFAKDGKTPVLRYDFADKIAYYFDDKGQVTFSRKWGWGDTSQELTYYQNGVPTFTQHWEVNTVKSDMNATPAKTVWYLSWVKQLRPDMTVSWQVNFWSTTGQVQSVDVPEKAPADAKYKAVPALPPPGSTTPAKSWTPSATPTGSPAGAPGSAPSSSASTTVSATAPAITPATPTTTVPGTAGAPPTVPSFFKPSGAHQTYSYSQKGYLTKVESFLAGKWTADKTVVHQESEHIRTRVNPGLMKPLPPGVRPSDKPKDPTPTNSAPFDFEDMD